MAKLVVLKLWRVQHRLATKLGWQEPCGRWQDARSLAAFDNEADALAKLAEVKRRPGAGCFEWRVNCYKVVASKAVA